MIKNRRCFFLIDSSPDPIDMDCPSVLKKFLLFKLPPTNIWKLPVKRTVTSAFADIFYFMNHNGVALPFMMIDYRISNSESQF